MKICKELIPGPLSQGAQCLNDTLEFLAFIWELMLSVHTPSFLSQVAGNHYQNQVGRKKVAEFPHLGHQCPYFNTVISRDTQDILIAVMPREHANETYLIRKKISYYIFSTRLLLWSEMRTSVMLKQSGKNPRKWNPRRLLRKANVDKHTLLPAKSRFEESQES